MDQAVLHMLWKRRIDTLWGAGVWFTTTLKIPMTLYLNTKRRGYSSEMKNASQTHRTWPAIAQHLATYDKAVFDPESVHLDYGGENTSEVFRFNLKRIEQECLECLHENSIFFVKAIRFEFLQVFKAD